MSNSFRNLGGLGDKISVPIPRDDDGFWGRECPVESCLGYFKVKPGTGLTGDDLLCHCPYCGHAESNDHFWTKDQIEYAKSVALRKITDAFREDLRQFEFDHKAQGPFGIGISMKLKPGAPVPIRHYREKSLETHITCEACTLDYAVYGVFAFCPDCGAHNSLQILLGNLRLTRSQTVLAVSLEDPDLSRHLLEDALENCISAFDGFGREACRVLLKDGDEFRISFQNLERAAGRLLEHAGFDLKGSVSAGVWESAHRGFMKRHVLAHKAGVVDQQYIDASGDRTLAAGRRLVIKDEEVVEVAEAVEELGRSLLGLLTADPG